MRCLPYSELGKFGLKYHLWPNAGVLSQNGSLSVAIAICPSIRLVRAMALHTAAHGKVHSP
jgi:hypothetical protein